MWSNSLGYCNLLFYCLSSKLLIFTKNLSNLIFLSVHNWTQEDTLQWLSDFVELPQYEKNFRDSNVNGTTLPR